MGKHLLKSNFIQISSFIDIIFHFIPSFYQFNSLHFFSSFYSQPSLIFAIPFLIWLFPVPHHLILYIYTIYSFKEIPKIKNIVFERLNFQKKKSLENKFLKNFLSRELNRAFNVNSYLGLELRKNWNIFPIVNSNI